MQGKDDFSNVIPKGCTCCTTEYKNYGNCPVHDKKDEDNSFFPEFININDFWFKCTGGPGDNSLIGCDCHEKMNGIMCGTGVQIECKYCHESYMHTLPFKHKEGCKIG